MIYPPAFFLMLKKSDYWVAEGVRGDSPLKTVTNSAQAVRPLQNAPAHIHFLLNRGNSLLTFAVCVQIFGCGSFFGKCTQVRIRSEPWENVSKQVSTAGPSHMLPVWPRTRCRKAVVGQECVDDAVWTLCIHLQCLARLPRSILGKVQLGFRNARIGSRIGA